ncbi:MAG: signal peptidase II [Spirochaetales bacterium]|nr:signal peptidase II [Spirochaetales bacterium]
MFQQVFDMVGGMSENTASRDRVRAFFPFILTLILVLADQITKLIVIAEIPFRTIAYSTANGFFRLIHVRNTGVAFSLGDSLPLEFRKALFIILPLAAMVALAVYIVKGKDETVPQKYCLAGILGGGVGNLIDRIFRPEGVVDFLDVKFYGLFGLERWPTFNVADAAVVVCGILLFITFWKKEKSKNE